MIKVVIPASGAGVRFGADMPKQFFELNGEPILKRTIAVFQNLGMIDEIAVAVAPGYAHMVEDFGFNKVRHIVEGGQDRASSVYAALKSLPKDTGIVLIHDGVRPFVTESIVRAVVDAVQKHGAAVACTSVTDTVKKIDFDNKITETIDRRLLWSAQTPQGFTYDIIMKAYQQAEQDGILSQVTDDSALVERMGIPVCAVRSDFLNMKITTKTDLIIAEAYMGITANFKDHPYFKDLWGEH